MYPFIRMHEVGRHLCWPKEPDSFACIGHYLHISNCILIQIIDVFDLEDRSRILSGAAVARPVADPFILIAINFEPETNKFLSINWVALLLRLLLLRVCVISVNKEP